MKLNKQIGVTRIKILRIYPTSWDGKDSTSVGSFLPLYILFISRSCPSSMQITPKSYRSVRKIRLNKLMSVFNFGRSKTTVFCRFLSSSVMVLNNSFLFLASSCVKWQSKRSISEVGWRNSCLQILHENTTRKKYLFSMYGILIRLVITQHKGETDYHKCVSGI